MSDHSPKRRRVAINDDLERTLTLNSTSSLQELHYRLPPPQSSASTRCDPSESSLQTSATSTRSKSPTKNTKKFQLQALRKPVLHKNLDDNASYQLPGDVQRLHNTFKTLLSCVFAFCPTAFVMKYRRQLANNYQILFSCSLNQRTMWIKKNRIQKSSVPRARHGRCRHELEGSRAPQGLKLALDRYGGIVDSEPATDACILPAFLPRIDGFMLDPTVTDENKGLTSTIRQVVMSDPEGMLSASHTNYQPLHFRPPASFIETKAAGSADQGRLRLGIFVAAQHERFESLIRKRRILATEPQPSIITLPHILTVEDDWKLFYDCDRQTSVEIGDIAIGDTTSLLGVYTLLAVLHRIAEYIATQFKSWIRTVFTTGEGR